MTFCSNCGKRIINGDLYCDNCGSKIDYGETNEIRRKEKNNRNAKDDIMTEKKENKSAYKLFLIPVVILLMGIILVIIKFLSSNSNSSPKNFVEDTTTSIIGGENRDMEKEKELSRIDNGNKEVIDESSETDNKSSENFIFPNSNIEYLTEDNLKEKSKEDIRIGRNEIYARHGRKFMDAELQKYFESQKWYEGKLSPDEFKEEMLNQYEKANVSFLKNYEDKYDNIH